MNNLYDKKPAWFRTHQQCPISNLPVIKPEVLPPIDPKSDYLLEIAKLGDQILLLKASGFVTCSQMVETLRFSDDYISQNFRKNQPIVVIEDYAHLKGTDFDARKKYFDYYKSRTFFVGAILYNMRPLIKFSLKLAIRLHFANKDGHVVDSYEQAIHFAQTILHQQAAVSKVTRPSFIRNFTGKTKLFELLEKIFKLPAKPVKRVAVRIINRIKGILIKEYSENLLKLIESVDWSKEEAQSILKNNDASQPIRKVLDAVIAMKKEVDGIIKERLQVEKGLRESEKEFRQLIDHAKAGICEIDYDSNKFTAANDSFLAITGYAKDEILSMSPTDILTDDGRKQFNERLSRLYSGEIISPDCVYLVLTKDKQKMKWVMSNTSFKYRNTRPYKANVIITDITQLKTAENKLIEYQKKLKHLSIQLSKSEEEQRRLFASELHDKISQEMFVVQLQLESFEKSLDNPSQIKKISKIKDQLIALIRETRNLIFDLSPPALYDFGFKEAVATLAHITKSKYGLRVATEFSGDMDELDDEIKFILYRSLKELIHNTIKHAHAKSLDVAIHYLQNDIVVTVKDDGTGFDAENLTAETCSNKGFGLFDIKEKINHLGGTLRLQSKPDQGTTVYMKVPLKKETSNACI